MDVNSTLVSDLSPEEQQELQAQIGNPNAPTSPVQTAPGVDLIDSSSPEELADVFVQTNGEGFTPAQWLAANKDKSIPLDKIQKVADSLALVRHRGFNLKDIEWGKSGKALLHLPMHRRQ